MKPKHIKDVLLSEIRAVAVKSEEFCYDSRRDFTRKRKLSFESMLKNIIGMGSKSLTNEMIDFTYIESPGAHDWNFWDTYIEKVIEWLPL